MASILQLSFPDFSLPSPLKNQKLRQLLSQKRSQLKMELLKLNNQPSIVQILPSRCTIPSKPSLKQSTPSFPKSISITSRATH